jgi:RAT1-interacting protein
VKVVEHFKTMEIPRLVRGKPNAWDPSICLDWGHRFLKSLKELLSGTDAGNSDGKTVWRAKFSPKEGVTVSKLDENGVLDVEGGEDRVGFLPRWYWDEISTTIEGAEATGTSPGTDGTSEPRVAMVDGWQL